VEPALRYPGAKWSLASWIIEHLPPHTSYLEPFFGSGAVFFNKPKSTVETINDVDGNIVNLFKMIREKPLELAHLVKFTPWSREEYYTSYKTTGEPLEDARRFMIRCWQAFGTRTNSRTGWRCDVQGRLGTCLPRQWEKVPSRIIELSDRLKEAQIESQPAAKILERYKFSNVLVYADPPYLLSTRNGKMYANEMTDNDHLELLEILDNHPGPVLLSGYSHPMYDDRLKHWARKTQKAHAEKGAIREEVLWINQKAAVATMPSLF